MQLPVLRAITTMSVANNENNRWENSGLSKRGTEALSRMHQERLSFGQSLIPRAFSSRPALAQVCSVRVSVHTIEEEWSDQSRRGGKREYATAVVRLHLVCSVQGALCFLKQIDSLVTSQSLMTEWLIDYFQRSFKLEYSDFTCETASRHVRLESADREDHL